MSRRWRLATTIEDAQHKKKLYPTHHFEGNAMNTENIKRLIATAFLAASVGGLAACNTVEGAGKDIEEAGEEIQEEANEAK